MRRVSWNLGFARRNFGVLWERFPARFPVVTGLVRLPLGQPQFPQPESPSKSLSPSHQDKSDSGNRDNLFRLGIRCRMVKAKCHAPTSLFVTYLRSRIWPSCALDSDGIAQSQGINGIRVSGSIVDNHPHPMSKAQGVRGVVSDAFAAAK